MTNLSSITVRTTKKNEWLNISPQVERAVSDSGIAEGVCVVFVPHTTAAITVNENSYPNVPRDVGVALDLISPDREEFLHDEGNSAAHTKTTLVGPSVTLIVSNKKLLMGTWQAIWFNEYDGPRTRKIHIRVMGE